MPSPRSARRFVATSILAGSLAVPAFLAAAPAGAATWSDSFDASTGTLTINDSAADAIMAIHCNGPAVTIKEAPTIFGPWATVKSFSDVTRVSVNGGAGDDFVSAESCNLATEIDGGAGIDILIGGSNDDVIRNGEGTSSVSIVAGGGGNDVIEVAAGSDPLFVGGGTGSDTLKIDVGGRTWSEAPWFPNWTLVQVSGRAPIAYTEFEGAVQYVNGPVTPPSGPNDHLNPQQTVRSGYWMLDENGTVYNQNPQTGERFGDAGHFGQPTSDLAFLRMTDQLGGRTHSAAVKLSPTPSGNGYRVLDNYGRVWSFGDAANVIPKATEVAQKARAADEWYTTMATTASGNGYWLFTNKGRVLTYGDAQRFAGPSGETDLTAVSLNGAIVDSAITIDGKGYYMLGADGGVFTFGNATFHGSTGHMKLNAPANGIVPDADGVGYRFVASDGGIFAFDAAFYGSLGDFPLNQPVNGMVSHGRGYLMVASDGGIFMSNPKHAGWIFSDLPFYGSLGNATISSPIISVASLYVVS